MDFVDNSLEGLSSGPNLRNILGQDLRQLPVPFKWYEIELRKAFYPLIEGKPRPSSQHASVKVVVTLLIAMMSIDSVQYWAS